MSPIGNREGLVWQDTAQAKGSGISKTKWVGTKLVAAARCV
jgi:hypothetical protein